ncbi:AmiS/UreI family transporter [Fodinisporobacter ferrooxydans]|uniref:AmiS/UreI family transporter n=1 Tax=Fodinisporobacter ferrooxydans TaxID=2901836 RepID=A0ABY4CMG0_9BACL|nr:AmiS/UreI family transporter [Alicyclobacillaceae bacterium MYW30-H2]
MSNVGLLYVGAVLFLNGLMLLGKISAKSAGIFNLFVGSLQVITPVYLIFTAHSMQDIFRASGIFLFGFTYLYVGVSNLTNTEGSGVGWYSFWVAVLALCYSLADFTYFKDFKFGIIWLMWAFLWFLFYLLLAQNRDIGVFTGWVTLIESWVTCTIPAFLSMTGLWNDIGLTETWIVTVVVVMLFFGLFFWTKGKHASVHTASL